MIGIQLGELVFLREKRACARTRTHTNTHTFRLGRMAWPICRGCGMFMVSLGMQRFPIPVWKSLQLPGDHILLFEKRSRYKSSFFPCCLGRPSSFWNADRLCWLAVFQSGTVYCTAATCLRPRQALRPCKKSFNTQYKRLRMLWLSKQC